jgi:hypothetical protein
LSPNAKQLVKIATSHLSAVAKVASKRRAQFVGIFRRQLVLGYINDDLERLLARELTGPADNVFFGVLVEIALAKGKRVERVE